jgi:hypothetical protein
MLKALSRKKGNYLLIVHRSINGALGNFEPVDVNDRQDCTRFSGIDVLETMPSARINYYQKRNIEGKDENIRCRWAGLCLPITNDAGDNKVRIIHHGTEGYTQSISQFTPFVDAARCFSIDVTENRRCYSTFSETKGQSQLTWESLQER